MGRDEDNFLSVKDKELLKYAPSWSWASCEGTTRFMHGNLHAGGFRANLVKVIYRGSRELSRQD